MAQRTVVHVGLPKTGTTYLQTTMWRQRPLLHERGVLYPGGDRMHHFHAARAVAGRPGRDGESEHHRAALVGAVRDWEGDALLSHEFFSQATALEAEQLAASLGDTELVVVVTARDYLRQVPAVWQEALKMGNASTLGGFVDELTAPGHQEAVRSAHEQATVTDPKLRKAWGWSTQDLAAVLDRWSRGVGAERIRLVTVPPPGAPKDLLWQRWCDASGLDLDGLDLSVAVPNESLGAPQARFLTLVVRHLGDELAGASVRHRWLRQYLGHEVLVPQRGDRIALDDDHAGVVGRLNAEMLREVASMDLPVVGDLADLEPSAASSGRDPDQVPDEEALAVAATAVTRMVGDVQRLHASASRPPAPAAPAEPVRSLVSRVRNLLHSRRGRR